ncbi:hypothetical protein N7535_008038 [Penicillium sp. DV-2018c]|nr:hypothetical protein N7461_004074 [Penicillium sp. DV-2018c]KAJ5566400.1 hypothetical protein N7535_008038 [Penicillium sp. DV-2018c]
MLNPIGVSVDEDAHPSIEEPDSIRVEAGEVRVEGVADNRRILAPEYSDLLVSVPGLDPAKATPEKGIMRRDEDVQEAVHRYARMRESNMAYHDGRKRLRTIPLEKGSLVLLHDTQRQEDATSIQKLRYRWSGPYRVGEVLGNGAYTLQELGCTPIYHRFSSGAGSTQSAVNGDRLKRFWVYKDTGVRQESFSPRDVAFEQSSVIMET